MPCNEVHPSVRGMGMPSSKVELLMQHCSNSGQMLFMTDRQIHVSSSFYLLEHASAISTISTHNEQDRKALIEHQ